MGARHPARWQTRAALLLAGVVTIDLLLTSGVAGPSGLHSLRFGPPFSGPISSSVWVSPPAGFQKNGSANWTTPPIFDLQTGTLSGGGSVWAAGPCCPAPLPAGSLMKIRGVLTANLANFSVPVSGPYFLSEKWSLTFVLKANYTQSGPYVIGFRAHAWIGLRLMVENLSSGSVSTVVRVGFHADTSLGNTTATSVWANQSRNAANISRGAAMILSGGTHYALLVEIKLGAVAWAEGAGTYAAASITLGGLASPFRCVAVSVS